MSVTAHHHEIRPAIGGVGQQDIFNPDVALGHAFDAGRDAVPSEMRAHVCAGHLLALAFFGDDHDVNGLRALEKRHGVADRPCSGAATIPAREHALERWSTPLDVGHHDEGASGLEECSFDHEAVD